MVEKKGLAKAWRCSDLTVLAVLILIFLVEAVEALARRGKVGHPAVLPVHPGSVVQQTWTNRAPAKSWLSHSLRKR